MSDLDVIASLLADTSMGTIQMIIDEAALTGCHPSVILDMAVSQFCGKPMSAEATPRQLFPVGFPSSIELVTH